MAGRISIFDDVAKSSGSANQFADDVVGRFHGGYLNGRKPVSLEAWRITSDDPEVAEQVATLFGGDAQEIENGDYTVNEVFTEATTVDIIIDSPESISSEFVLWGQDGKVAMRGDGVTLDDGTPDPGADLPLAERKTKAKAGLLPAPQTEIFFRLADNPELGIFKFIQRAAWNLERNLARDGFYDVLDDAEGPIKAQLIREPVSFLAKSGPMAGKQVNYTATELKYTGKAA
jgi:hypothetical protein